MPHERTILFFTCTAHALTHVFMLLFTSLIDPMRADFDLEVDEFTRYATISTVLFGLGALPAGWLGDRWGEKHLLVAFFFLTGLGGLVLGLAQSHATLAAAMALIGLGASIFHPVGNSLIARGMRRPGKAMGINGLWGSIGTAAGPGLASVMAYFFGWRAAYLSLVLPMLLLGTWLATTRIELPAHSPDPSDKDPGPDTKSGPRVSRRGGSAFIVSFLLVAATCGGLVFHLITTMLPKHAQAAHGASQLGILGAGLIATTIYLIGGAGQIVAGILADSREGRGLYLATLLTATPLVYLTGLFHGPALVVCGGAMAVFLFAVQPVENVLLSRYANPSSRGLLFGMKFVLAFGLGGLGTGIAGWVEKRYGTSGVFNAAAIGAAAATLSAFVAWSRGRARAR